MADTDVERAGEAAAALGWSGQTLPRTTLREAEVFPVVDLPAGAGPEALRIVGLISVVGRRYSRDLAALYRVRDLGRPAFCVCTTRGPRRSLLLQAEYYGISVTHGGELALQARHRVWETPPKDLRRWQELLHALATTPPS
jgi:hypothetical protein